MPETFDGSTGGWEDWVEHFERVATVNGWTEDATKLKWLQVRLTGRAATAYKRFAEATKDSYARSKAALKNRFEPDSRKEIYMVELQTRRKRKGEDWAAFGEDVRILAEKAYPGLQPEAQEALALNHYLAQLDSAQVAFGVRQKKPATVEDAVQITLELESYLLPSKPGRVGQVGQEDVGQEDVGQEDVGQEDVGQEDVGMAAAVTPTGKDAITQLLERMDKLEATLKSSKPPRARGEANRRGDSSVLSQKPGGESAIVCYRCGKEGHYARGCAVRRVGGDAVGAVAAEGNGSKGEPEEEMVGQAGKGEPKEEEVRQEKHADTIPAFSVNSAADYHLHGTVNGVATRFLVDTGAVVTLLSKGLWNQVNAERKYKLSTNYQKRLVGVQGSPLEICGTAEVRIMLSEEEFDTLVYVVDSLTTEVILGRDFLKKHSCVIDVGQNLIQFGGRGLTMALDSEAGGQQVAFVSVMLESELKVPAYSEVEVVAKVPRAASNRSWIVEGEVDQKAVLVARSIVHPEGQEVPLRLLNPRKDPITAKSGTVVAQMEFIEDPSESPVCAVNEDSIPVPEGKRKMLWDLANEGDGLDDGEREKLFLLLVEFADVFASDPVDFGRTEVTTHHINTGDARPIRQHTRRIPPFRREEVRKLLQDMLKKRVVSPSKSPWASPIVLVKKKNGSLRFCVDYRKVNGRMLIQFRGWMTP